mgnify:FL=1
MKGLHPFIQNGVYFNSQLPLYKFINFPTIPHMNEIDREKMQQHDVNTESIEIGNILQRIGSFWL